MDKKTLASTARALLLSAAAIAAADSYHQEAEACARCTGDIRGTWCTWTGGPYGGSYCSVTMFKCDVMGVC